MDSWRASCEQRQDLRKLFIFLREADFAALKPTSKIDTIQEDGPRRRHFELYESVYITFFT